MCIILIQVKYRGVEQLVARRAHNPEVAGSSPVPATKETRYTLRCSEFFLVMRLDFESTTDGFPGQRTRPRPVEEKGMGGLAQQSKVARALSGKQLSVTARGQTNALRLCEQVQVPLYETQRP